MSNALWLLAIVVAATGAAFIGVALNGWRRHARRRLWKSAARVAPEALESVAPGTLVCIHGTVIGPKNGVQPAAFSDEPALYQRIILEEWKRDWNLCFAETRGATLTLEVDGGIEVAAQLADAEFVLASLSMRFATQMFDEEDHAEYTQSVPAAFRTRVVTYVHSHPGTYRVRAERVPLGARVFVIGTRAPQASTAAGDSLEAVPALTLAAQPYQPLYISDLSERELFAPAHTSLLLLSMAVGSTLLGYGIWLLVQTS
jgi:hypothetical protein